MSFLSDHWIRQVLKSSGAKEYKELSWAAEPVKALQAAEVSSLAFFHFAKTVPMIHDIHELHHTRIATCVFERGKIPKVSSLIILYMRLWDKTWELLLLWYPLAQPSNGQGAAGWPRCPTDLWHFSASSCSPLLMLGLWSSAVTPPVAKLHAEDVGVYTRLVLTSFKSGWLNLIYMMYDFPLISHDLLKPSSKPK